MQESLPPLCRNVHFTGDTFPCHDYLRALGCHWDRDKRCWSLIGAFDKWSLKNGLWREGIRARAKHPRMARDDAVYYFVDYNPKIHRRTADFDGVCRCRPDLTCAACRYVCCDAAEPLEMVNGNVRFSCRAHGASYWIEPLQT